MIVGSVEKSVDPGIVEPWPEVIGGSKNLNCKRIFRFANLFVGSENVGSARKVSDPDRRIRMVSFYVAAESQRLSISPGPASA